jgi:sulfopyruvate decarboxylase subunit alpha
MEQMKSTEEAPLRGQSIIQAIVNSGVENVIALPDIVTCESTLWPILSDNRLTLTQICKEDEGVSICAGLSYCDKRSVLLMQHTGFLDSVNAIRAIAVDYQLPIVMIVGLQGMEVDRPLAQSASRGIRILQPICDAMELDNHVLVDDSNVHFIESSIDKAYSHSSPVVLFVARSPEK